MFYVAYPLSKVVAGIFQGSWGLFDLLFLFPFVEFHEKLELQFTAVIVISTLIKELDVKINPTYI